jgi:hypothetical protein
LILHTYHPEGFDIVSESSDLQKSEHYTDFGTGLKGAYDFLFKKINCKSVIWCYPHYYFPSYGHGYSYRRWELDVPESEVIAYLNRNVWDSIIAGIYHVPNATYMRWHEAHRTIEDTIKYDEYIEAKEKEFQEKHGPNWNEKILFRKKLSRNCNIEILIPSPIKKEWVIDTTLLTFYDNDHCSYGGGHMFTTECAADKWIEVTSSFLCGRKIEHTITKEKKSDEWFTVTVDRKDQNED